MFARKNKPRACAKTFALPIAIAASSVARALVAQTIPGLDKGHQIFLNQGLQIEAQCFLAGSTSNWTVARWNQSNFTTINWQSDSQTPTYYSAPGVLWGRWADTSSNFSSSYTAPTASEQPYASNYISLQLGDEQNINTWDTDPNLKPSTLAWFAAARPNFPNTLLFLNQQGNEDSAANIAAYMADAQPDMLMFDSYPIVKGVTIVGGSLQTMYIDQAKYRALGLAGNDGIGQHPIPVGHYTENFSDGNFWPRYASDSEMRLQQFSAWTFGEKLVSSFVYNSPNVSNISSEFFAGIGVSSPTTAFTQITETNRQSRNLGPALVRLLSSDIKFIPGQNTGGTNPTPTGMSNWTAGSGNDNYITSISATNLGTLNSGLKGDVLVGHFKVLDESLDGSQFNNEQYFMLTNGLTDANGTAAQTQQQLTVNFDFGVSGLNSLERLSRDTGQVETISLTHLAGGDGALYQYAFTLDGGTGDLFKYNDGAPFVGVQVASSTMYWDADGNASNNNTGNGSGLGGSGSWDSALLKWHNGAAADVAWVPGSDAVFWGTAGTVTLSSPQSANSLSFKTTGYIVTGSTLTMTGSSVSTDSGVTATLGSVIAGAAGINKQGTGTLALTNTASTYNGPTTISAGILNIANLANINTASSIGKGSSGGSAADLVINGGTLQFTGTTSQSTNRLFTIGTSGATIDSSSPNNSSIGFTGTGALSITGTSARILKLTGSSTGANTIASVIGNDSSGNLTTLVKDGNGTWILTGNNTYGSDASGQWTKINVGTLQVSSDANLGHIPASRITNINLSATLRLGASFTLNGNRVVKISSALPTPGVIDTNGFTLTIGGSANLQGGPGTLFVIGGGTLNANSGNTWGSTLPAGTVNLTVDNATVTGSNAAAFGSETGTGGANLAISLLDNGTLMPTASYAIARNIILGAGGGGAINTNGNTNTITGAVSGSGALTKKGSGTLSLTSSNPYSGGTNINAGTLSVSADNNLGAPGADLSFNGGTLQLTGSLLNSSNRKISLAAGGGTINTNGNNADFGSIDPGPFTKAGAGQMNVTAINATALTINNGTLHVRPSALSAVSTSVLSAAPVIAPTGQLDIEDNALIVNYSASDTTHNTRDQIRNLLVSGRNGAAGQPGAWNGLGGIVSTFAHNNGNGFNLAIGYGDNEDIALVRGSGSYTAFGGQTVASNTVLVQMTRGADATLDGVVDAQDVTILGSHFMKPGSGQWVFGDFDYSGTCDASDVTTLGATFGKTAPTLSPAQMTAEFGAAFTQAFEAGQSGTVVPEPGSLPIFALSMPVFAMLSRRRKTGKCPKASAAIVKNDGGITKHIALPAPFFRGK